ncbi:MAG TPA: PQQ-dependent sugar dehydrogenase, partial [Candidatus Dormibacteraeota bacterium]
MTLASASAVLLALVLTACGSGSASTPPRATATTSTGAASTPTATIAVPAVTPAPANPCALGAQAPPAGTVSAAYPTALAFAPDGRLFWAERAGTVRVWQNGASKVFATVPTVTTEAGGGYSERGLLGLAIAPTFAHD